MIRFHITPPRPDESLSSVLDRACGLFNICRAGVIRQMIHVNSCDFDAPPQKVCEALASATQTSYEAMQRLSVPAERAWMLVKRADRDAYCPLCADEDIASGMVPYFRLDWSRLWVTHCHIHGTPLMQWRDMSSTGQRMIAHAFYVGGASLPRWFDANREAARAWIESSARSDAFALWRAIRAVQAGWMSEGVGDPRRIPGDAAARKEVHVGRLAKGFMALRRGDRACLGSLLAVSVEQSHILTYRYRRPQSRFTVHSIRDVRAILTDVHARHLVTALVGWAFGELDTPLHFATGKALPAADTDEWLRTALGFQNLPPFRRSLEFARPGGRLGHRNDRLH